MELELTAEQRSTIEVFGALDDPRHELRYLAGLQYGPATTEARV